MASPPVVIVTTGERVLIVEINRPARRNAVNREVSEQVAAALDELDATDELGAAIIVGAGGIFCAGLDLAAFARGEQVSLPGRGFAGITERPPAKPVIAAVEGFALAGGFEIALACDLIVAARDAVFGLPEVKRGLVAAGGGLLRLPERVPRNVAMELALTGGRLGAERGHHLGLVNQLSAPGDALADALVLARAVAANAPLAVAVTKRILRESADWHTDEAYARQRTISAPVFASADAQEGALAFLEKRPAVWRNT